MGKVQLTEEYLRTLEAKARIKMNELKSEKLFDQAKTDFADYITTLYESGRHLHVILAADFWRRIFDQGDYPVAMAQQVNAALEMTQEIQNALKVCATQLEEANVAAATERLKEAFMLNERDPAVLGFPRAGKRKVEAFSKSLDQMQNVIEARDFTNLESLIENMKTVAPDFDATKPRAVVNAVKLQSKLRLGRAKLAAQQGDLKLALEEFQAAAEAWPGNPDLESNATTFFEGQDSRTQALQEFDRLVTENNYRQIFEKQVALAPALKDDTKRQEEFKAALEKIKAAEMAIEKANLLRANGDIFGAWESVELASADLPNDTKLNAMRGELSGKGSEFVAAINKAKDAEAKQQLGYSLTWYAIAQQHYPASQMANQAIERLSGQILSSSL
jgi:tetratricopeptide (TPR) repeat protein